MILASEIYPPSLSLRQKNKDRSRADVLDMHVSLAGGIVTTKVYCKADAFPFYVISPLFLERLYDIGPFMARQSGLSIFVHIRPTLKIG